MKPHRDREGVDGVSSIEPFGRILKKRHRDRLADLSSIRVGEKLLIHSISASRSMKASGSTVVVPHHLSLVEK